MRTERGEKFSKRVDGKPIIIGRRTLIPVIEYSIYSKRFKPDKHSNEFLMMGVVVTPISIKVVEDGNEWVLTIQENNIS